MKNTPIAGCLAAAFMTCAVPAAAQDGSWDTSFTFCLWTVETDTSISTALGTIESTLPFSDALDNLDFAFMGSVEARNGRWSLIGDLAHASLSFSSDTLRPAFGGVDADVKLQVVNAYGLYNVHNESDL